MRSDQPRDDDFLDLPLDDAADDLDALGFGGGDDSRDTLPIAARPSVPRTDQAPPRPDETPPRPDKASLRTPAKPLPRARRGGWLPLLLVALGLPVALGVGYLVKPAPPAIAVDVDLLELGAVRVGEEARGVVTIRNAGEARLRLGPAVLVDVEAPEVEALAESPVLRIVDDGCSGVEVAAGERCGVEVALAPAAPGPVRARLRFDGEKVAERTVPLLGRGVAPALAATPARLDFGETVVGRRGVGHEVWLANQGDSTLRIDEVRLVGPAAADFVRSADRCHETTLEPGGRCSLRFDFVPTLEGERSARLAVRSDAFAGGEAAMPRLIGRALPQLPALALSAERFDFDAVRVDEAAPTQELTIANDGDAPLRLARLAIVPPVEGDEAVLAASSFTLDSDCVTTVAPGTRCSARIAFTPARAGALAGLLEIEHGDGVQTVPLVGRGIAPRLMVSPERVAFGEAGLRRASAWSEVTVVNEGDAAMRWERVGESLRLAGGEAGAFELRSECTGELAPGAGCDVELRFTPRREGPQRAELVVVRGERASDGEARVTLDGVGVAGRLVVDPGQLVFRDVQVGAVGEQSIRLTNDGRAPLRVVGAEVEGDGFSMVRDCAGVELAPGAECSLQVRFAPRRAGPRVGRVTVRDDLAASPRRVSLEALALAPPTPRLNLAPDRLDFGTVEVWQRSAPREVVVRNDGTGPLALRAIDFEGPAANDFRRGGGSCGDRLAPGASCTIAVFFAPTEAGRRDAVLAIRSNADPSLRRLLLSGDGVAPAPPPAVD
ncbi:MAG: choice-of-anchor D domain-containing protein [Acidobacteriota bacterium]